MNKDWPSGVFFGPLEVEFWFLGFDFEHLQSFFGPLEVEFWFLGLDFEHLCGNFGHLEVAFESMGVGSWPLGVDFFGL